MKKITGVILIMFVILISLNLNSVLAFGSGFDQSKIPNDSTTLSNVKAPLNRVAKTILLVLQVASIAGVLVLGVKYMFTSAEQKAEYKKSLLPVIVGIVLVFGASTVAQFVVNVFEEAII